MKAEYLLGDPPTRYHRTIEIRPRPGHVSGELQDAHHHFTLDLELDGTTITSVEVGARRSPWETCVVGGDGLQALEGLDVVVARQRTSWRGDPSRHCLHCADLAALAVEHACDERTLRYDIEITDPSSERRRARIDRGGTKVFEWTLEGSVITAPQEWSGISVDGGGFRAWVEANLDALDAETALVLRRACGIARGSGLDLDAVRFAGDVHAPDESCHTYRSTVAFTARRRIGSSRLDY